METWIAFAHFDPNRPDLPTQPAKGYTHISYGQVLRLDQEKQAPVPGLCAPSGVEDNPKEAWEGVFYLPIHGPTLHRDEHCGRPADGKFGLPHPSSNPALDTVLTAAADA